MEKATFLIARDIKVCKAIGEHECELCGQKIPHLGQVFQGMLSEDVCLDCFNHLINGENFVNDVPSLEDYNK